MSRKFVNMDADESIFFLRQLEHIKTKTYDVVYPELKARQFIPVSMDAGPGAKTITYQQFDMIGMAKIISNYASDLPRVDLKGKEFTANVRSLGDSYGYSLQDLRSAKMAGIPLDQRKASAAKRAMAQLEDDLACNGDATHGLGGLFSNANIPDVSIPADGTGASALWSTKTGDQMVRDLNLLVSAILDNTKGTEEPNSVILPLAQWNLFSTTRLANTNVTAMEFFLRTSPYIKTVDIWTKLKGAGSGGTDLMMAYNRSPDKLTLEIPQDFEQLPVQEEGLEYEVPCHQRFGGVIIYYPLSLAKGHGI